MSEQEGRRFNYTWNAVSSLGIGCLITMTVMIAGVLISPPKIGDFLYWTLLWPGFSLAQWYYGGFHGGEPFLLEIVVNSFVYGGACFLVLWLRSRRRSVV